MTIRHLKIFITVAECGKMGLAAEKLFISQPSVSQAIREIEEHYGVKLFERLSKKLYITASGELLLKYARHIIQSFEEMEVGLKHSGQYVCLRIGATITVGSCMLEPVITAFEKRYEEVETKIIVNNTNIIEQMLLQSQLDVAIIEGDISHPDLVKQAICTDELVIAVGKGHVLYGYKEIEIGELEGHYLIGREQGSGVRNLFKQTLWQNNVSMPIKWECSNTEAIKSATIGGQGIAVLPYRMIEEEIKNKTLHMISLKGIKLSRDICVVLHKNKFISKQLEEFLECIKECM